MIPLIGHVPNSLKYLSNSSQSMSVLTTYANNP